MQSVTVLLSRKRSSIVRNKPLLECDGEKLEDYVRLQYLPNLYGLETGGRSVCDLESQRSASLLSRFFSIPWEFGNQTRSKELGSEEEKS